MLIIIKTKILLPHCRGAVVAVIVW